MNFTSMLNQLTAGMITSVQIFFVTLILSIPLGFVVYFAKMSRFVVIRFITNIYISIMRGTPLMLQLMVVYFGPYYIFGLRISANYAMTAVMIGFAINYAAYFAEIYRSGMIAIPDGQREAGKALGLNRVQIFFYILLPQMFRNIMPTMTNEFMTLIKDTSLAMVLSVMEMFTTAKQIASSQTTMIPFIVAGIFYYIFNLIVATIMNYLEKRMNYY